METTVPILLGLAALALLGLGAVLDDRRARVRRRRQRAATELVRPLLHSINDDRCIGCEACVDVCPTEVLDLVEHKVRVVRFSDCVQCEQCAHACPTQALVMYRQGTTPRMLTVPEIDEHFQTGVPGQYLIGEVAGKPLVKNAANLGRAVIERIARELAPAARAVGGAAGDGGDPLDVVIVGSGPGGLSAGLACIKHRLSCLVLEKEHVISSTVSRYPKGKHFMAEPSSAANLSYLPVFDGSKEQLVAAWRELVDAVELPIRLGEAVESVVRGDDGTFAIKTTVASYRARTVVLATGLRGKPRLLAVPGANLEKVQSLLDDPAEFAREDVLVVGGGDSAVEGAMALAELGARVTLSYRGDGFKRCKPGNQKRLAELTAAGKLDVLLESNVKCFTPDAVTIVRSDRSEATIANTRAFVLIGADTPVAWLEANGVRFIERPHLYALGSTEDAVRRYAPDAAPCPASPDEALAALLDRPAPRSSVQRVREVAHQIAEEVREVVTSVSQAFRLDDLEPPARPPARPPRRPRTRRGTAARLASGSAPAPAPFGATTDVMPSLRTLELRALSTSDGVVAATVDSVAERLGAVPQIPAAPAIPAATPVIAVIPAVSPIEPMTEESPSLRTREYQSDELAGLRGGLDGPTDETPSLRTREYQLDELAGLRGGLDGPTDETPSLRTLAVASTVQRARTVPPPPPTPPRRARGVPPPIPPQVARAVARPPALPVPPAPKQLARGSECMPRRPLPAPAAMPSDEDRTEEITSLRALEAAIARDRQVP